MQKLKTHKDTLLSFLNKNFSGKEILSLTLLSILSLVGILLLLNSILQRFWIDRIVYKGEISEGIVGTASHTHIVFGEEESTKSISNILFSPLVKKNEKDENIFDLAKDIKYDSKNLTYTITLKDKIYFQDKKIITSDDLIYTWNLVKTSDSTKNLKPVIENLEILKIDNKNITLKLKKENLKTSKLFEIGILPKHVFDGKETDFSNVTEKIIGSSPFKISTITRKSDASKSIESVVFERFNNGGEKLPYIKNFTLHFFGNSTDASDSLFKQEINLIANIDSDGLERLKIKNQNLKTQRNSTDKNFALFFNQSKNDILKSQKFRKILSEIIDRNYLAKNVVKEFASPKQFLFDTKIENPNLEKAFSLLASTSLVIENNILYNSATKDGKKVKTGEAIEMSIATPNVPELINTANFLKTEFAKIGLKVNIDILSNEVLPETLKNRNFEILLFAFDLQNPSDLYNFFNSDERKYPKLNIANYVNKNVDKLTNELKENSNPEEKRKAEILTQIESEISNDLPVILLYAQNTVSVFLENNTKIILPKDLQNAEDKYKFLPYWYVNTEKIFSFWNFKFLNKIEEWIY
jgi:peptide/nickel transport system substrate-binding protein